MGLARSKVRRRFLAVAIPGLAVVLAITGIGYLAGTGSVTATVQGGSNSSYLYLVTANNTIPAPSLKWSSITVTTSANTITTAQLPVITASKTPAQVSTPGDLALVDARSTNVAVSMYVTNLAVMRTDYLSFELPVVVYKATCTTTTSGTCSATSTWAITATLTPTPTTGTPITTTTGLLSFHMTSGFFYDITVRKGGFLSKSGTGTYAAPKFYFTAQQY